MNFHYIIGCFRSGTTLLSAILGAHSQVIAYPELNIILTLYSKYAHLAVISPKVGKDLIADFLTYYENLSSNFKFSAGIYSLHKTNLQNDIEQIDHDKYFIDYCCLIYSNIKFIGEEQKNANNLIEKNPRYTWHYDKILNYDPNAKFIGIVRDYRDVVSSCIKSQRLGLGFKASFYAILWNSQNKQLLKLKKEKPDQLCIIQYKDLVIDSQKEIKRICDFLGIQMEMEMFNFHSKFKPILALAEELEDQVIRERMLKKYGNLSTKVFHKFEQVWRKRLTQKQQKTCEIICHATGKKFHFEKEFDWHWRELFGHYVKQAPYYALANMFLIVDRIRYKVPTNLNLLLMNTKRKLKL